MRFLVALFTLLFALPVWAIPVEIRWVEVTTRTDGTALDPSEIKHYAISYGLNGDDSAPTNVTTRDTSYVMDLEPGNYYFCVATVDTGDITSESRCDSDTFEEPPKAKPSIITEIIIRVLENGNVEVE